MATNAVILRSDETQVLLTQRADNGLWCLPGGLLEVGESLDACVRREVMEEIGCVVEVDKLVGVYSQPNLRVMPPATHYLVVVCVLAQIVDGVPRTSNEVVSTGFFPIDDLPTLVPNQSERIHHAATGAGTVLM